MPSRRVRRALSERAGVANSWLPEGLDRLGQIQSGVLTRQQALDDGMPPYAVDRLIAAGRWRPLFGGVYSIYTGRAGPRGYLLGRRAPGWTRAVLSFDSAAEVQGLIDKNGHRVHVSIPQERTVLPARGLVPHRSSRLQEAAHPTDLPPRTRIEETVLDLAGREPSFEAAFAIACAACQRRLTTPARLHRAMAARAKLRRRAELTAALADVGAGVHSLLEYRYVRFVERLHGLPAAVRQAHVVIDGCSRYLDNLYGEFGVCVELDGRKAHPDDRRWLDVRRDNATAAGGLITLRYTWADIEARPCETAVQVSQALRTRGWTGRPRRCGPRCAVPAARDGRPRS